MKRLQLLLVSVLLSMPMIVPAQEEDPIVLELYCYGQVTANVADGHSGRGNVCVSTSSTAPEALDEAWKSATDMVQSYQYLPVRQSDVAPIMSALAGMEIEVNLGPTTYSVVATMAAQPLYVHAQVTKEGYYFEGWKDSKGVIVSEDPDQLSYAVKEGWNVQTAPYAEGEEVYAEMGPLYASFPHLEIGEVSGDLVIHPTRATATTSHTISISVPHADAKSDFALVDIESLTGYGAFELTSWDCYDGTVTVHYNFYLSDADGSRPGVSTAQLKIRTKGGESEKIVKLRANYANIASGNAPMIVCAPKAIVDAVATFATQYADDADFPDEPEFADKKWVVTDHNYSNNVLTVNYRFTAPESEGTYTTDLTLTTLAGVSKTIPVTAIVENTSATDAVVLNASGNTIKTGTLAEAITYINTHSDADTISVRKNVTITEALPEITNSVVIDLRGKTITNTIDSRAPVFVLNGFGKEVTITDSREDGTINHQSSVAGELAAIDVLAGKLIIGKSKIIARNNSSDASASAIAITIQSGAQCEMQLQSDIKATANDAQATGIRNAGYLTTYGGELTVHATSNAIGIDISGTCTLKGGSFTVKSDADAKGLAIGSSASLTMNDGEIYVSANMYANTSAYAIYCVGEATIEKGILKANASTAYTFFQNGNGKTSVITGGKFSAEGDVVANVYQQNGTLEVSGGVYTTDANLAALATANAKVRKLNNTCTDYAANYRYAVGDNPNVAVAQIGDMTFPSLINALSYVNNNPNLISTIVLLEDETLPADKKYTLPSNATLLIPYYEGQDAIDIHPERESSYTAPNCFRTLTLEEGARLDIYGAVQVGAKQGAIDQTGGNNGVPTEAYGKIDMLQGSSMTVEGGGHLYAWGYVVGKGTIDVKRNGTVHEMMQIKDWRGGKATFSFNDNIYKVFPLNQYYIQNVEVPATFRPGSKELIDGAVYALSNTWPFTDVLLIGGNGQKCMFSMDLADMSEDTWVRKSYDAVHDLQVYEINNSAQISSLVLSLNVAGFMTVSFNSAMYVLPLTNNMKIHLLTGELAITQDVLLTPGAEIEVDKEATAYIVENKNLFVMDAADWMEFKSGIKTYPISYSPSWTNGCPRRSTDALEDAKINVHGTFRVDGAMYTTEHGANIFSSNDDAGTLLINNAAPSADYDNLYLANNTLSDNENAPNYQKRVAYPAQLRNGDAKFAETRGAEAGRTYAYYNDHWRNWETVDCLAKETKNDGTEVYYAKPADYVPLASSEPNAADHLYHLAATDPDNGQALTPRLFILMDDCQWWEVTKVPNQDELYYCAKNNVYYFYDEAGEVPQWKEKLLTVRWLDSDGTTLLHEYTNVHYGDKAQYFHDDPVKAPDGYKTYDFIGWLPEPAEHLTSDASYVAQYQENIKECTITFRDANGDLIEQNQVQIGQVPVCTGAPAGIGELYDWYPPIHAVTADEEYQLVAREIKTNYTITFLDWNNTSLWEGEVAAGKTISVSKNGNDYYLTVEGQSPSKFTANPSKSVNAGRQYTLTGWSPTLAEVNGDAIYTAVYEESMQTFVITTNATGDGAVAITPAAANNEYAYGSTITLTATPNTGSYLKQWQDNLVATERTITVTGDATYTATFSNSYSVVLRLNGGTFVDDGKETRTINYTYSNGVIALPGKDDVSKGAWRPLGWHKLADFSDPAIWSIPATTAENFVLYMKWGDASQEEFLDQPAKGGEEFGGYYSTFSSSVSNYELSEGFTAYKAVIQGEYIHLQAIGNIIPKNEGVLIYSATQSHYDLTPTDENAPIIGQNDFRGTNESTVTAASIYSEGATPYVFSAMVDGVPGFYKLNAALTIPEHKAYVVWPGGNSAPPRVLRFVDRPGVATDIIDTEDSKPVMQKGIFSILGHELTEPVHGTINIIDGELKYIP